MSDKSWPMGDSKTENPDSTANIEKLNSIAQQAKNQGGGTPFMEPGTKNKGGRPPKPRDAQGNIIKSAPAQPKQKKTGSPHSGSPNGGTVAGAQIGSQSNPQATAQGVGAVAPLIPTDKIVRPAVKLLSRVGVGLAGTPQAAMSQDELDDISLALGLVADKWMPNLMAQYGPEAALLIALGTWGTKVVALKKLVDEERAKIEDAEKFKTQNQQPTETPNAATQVQRDFSVVSKPETTAQHFEL